VYVGARRLVSVKDGHVSTARDVEQRLEGGLRIPLSF
jgi:hypothetical protein